jgi:hypothetical protein
VSFRVRAGVAQLVEQRFRKPQVVRSIRIAGSILSRVSPGQVNALITPSSDPSELLKGASGCESEVGSATTRARPRKVPGLYSFDSLSVSACTVNGAFPSEQLLTKTYTRRFSTTAFPTNSTVSRRISGSSPTIFV